MTCAIGNHMAVDADNWCHGCGRRVMAPDGSKVTGIKGMIHATLTGVDAGRPLCDVDRATAREQGDTFQHVPYSHIDQFFARPEVCHKCRSEWDAAGDAKPLTDAECIAYWSS